MIKGMLENASNNWKPLLSFSRSQSPLWERNVLSSSVTKPVFIALRLGKQGLGNENRGWWLMRQKNNLTVLDVPLNLSLFNWERFLVLLVLAF